MAIPTIYVISTLTLGLASQSSTPSIRVAPSASNSGESAESVDVAEPEEPGNSPSLGPGASERPFAEPSASLSVRSGARDDRDRVARRVLILGDSFVRTDFGDALERGLDAHGEVVCARRGQSATGLARPDAFDWWAEAEAEIHRHAPALIVVILGGNDGQDLRGRELGSTRRVLWGSKAWRPAYQARIHSFVELLARSGRRVVWLELPMMDAPKLERKLAIVREAQREVLGSRSEVATYVATRAYFEDQDGRLLRHVRVSGFQGQQPMRLEDGVHFSLPGGRYFAEKVRPIVLAELGLGDPVL